MTWQDDYYLGSSDYPVTGSGEDIDPDGDFELVSVVLAGPVVGGIERLKPLADLRPAE